MILNWLTNAIKRFRSTLSFASKNEKPVFLLSLDLDLVPRRGRIHSMRCDRLNKNLLLRIILFQL